MPHTTSSEDREAPSTSAGTSEPNTSEILDLIHQSHDRLAAALAGLDGHQVAGQSYDDEWSIAQVASHLGSSAEVFGLHLDAGLRGTPAADIEIIRPIWDRWNAKTPVEQARDGVTADATFLDRVDGLTDDERVQWELDLYGATRDLPGLLRMRLAEHALHTWDIVVALDPEARVADGPVPLILDGLWWLIEYVAKPTEESTLRVVTSTPSRELVLELTAAGAHLTSAASSTAGEPTAELRIPAEAFVRLVYGRLDPDHTPDDVEVIGIDLDVLRRTFPGV